MNEFIGKRKSHRFIRSKYDLGSITWRKSYRCRFRIRHVYLPRQWAPGRWNLQLFLKSLRTTGDTDLFEKIKTTKTYCSLYLRVLFASSRFLYPTWCTTSIFDVDEYCVFSRVPFYWLTRINTSVDDDRSVSFYCIACVWNRVDTVFLRVIAVYFLRVIVATPSRARRSSVYALELTLRTCVVRHTGL